MTDYAGMSYRELLAQRSALNAEIEKARDGERNAVIEEIREKMTDYGITLPELDNRVGKGARKDKGLALPPKYRDPDSGATWSGRGKPPLWIAGKPRDTFLIA
jgi:DNA-binding protein H-NS